MFQNHSRGLERGWLTETRSLPMLPRSYPRRFTFYVADPISSIVSRLLPLARPLPHGFTGHVARPVAPFPIYGGIAARDH